MINNTIIVLNSFKRYCPVSKTFHVLREYFSFACKILLETWSLQKNIIRKYTCYYCVIYYYYKRNQVGQMKLSSKRPRNHKNYHQSFCEVYRFSSYELLTISQEIYEKFENSLLSLIWYLNFSNFDLFPTENWHNYATSHLLCKNFQRVETLSLIESIILKRLLNKTGKSNCKPF